jgi:hypothetical protein
MISHLKRSERFPAEHCCSRGVEGGQAVNKAVWMSDDCCSWCGSLNPDIFMELLESEIVVIEPTDKNYKVYVRTEDGSKLFKMMHSGQIDPGANREDPANWTWTIDERNHTKFYFQHLDEAQKIRFVELLNLKKLRFDYPGFFYRIPYFISEPSGNPK